MRGAAACPVSRALACRRAGRSAAVRRARGAPRRAARAAARTRRRRSASGRCRAGRWPAPARRPARPARVAAWAALKSTWACVPSRRMRTSIGPISAGLSFSCGMFDAVAHQHAELRAQVRRKLGRAQRRLQLGLEGRRVLARPRPGQRPGGRGMAAQGVSLPSGPTGGAADRGPGAGLVAGLRLESWRHGAQPTAAKSPRRAGARAAG